MREQTVGEKADFSGEVAAVTGGAQGIGRAIVESFAASGADVAVLDVQTDEAAATAEEVAAETDADVLGVECDVTDYDSVTTAVETVIDELGRLDHLINNAGVGTATPSFMESDPEDWDTAIDVCLYGTMHCTHAVLPHMTERGSGSIVNFASDSYKGNDPGLAVYGAAKAGNVSFTGTVAKEVGEDGVRINCLSPGTTYTPATEDWLDEYGEKVLESYALDRLGQPEDIADGVTFLCSDAADWVTGETLSVNGGYFRG